MAACQDSIVDFSYGFEVQRFWFFRNIANDWHPNSFARGIDSKTPAVNSG
jgi:hypothetical protein